MLGSTQVTACHRMCTDEFDAFGQQSWQDFDDTGFDATDIGQQASRLERMGDVGHELRHRADGRAQHDQICPDDGVDRRRDAVDDSRLESTLEGCGSSSRTDDLDGESTFASGLGDRSSQQPEPEDGNAFE